MPWLAHTPLDKRSPHGYGISKRSRRRPYIAKLYRSGRLIYLGSHYTLWAAQRAIENYLKRGVRPSPHSRYSD